MSGVLRHWQQPEWSARSLWDFASSVLAKTYEYNPSADDWRLLRPVDIPGMPVIAGTNGWELQIALGAAAWTTVITAAGFRVPQGIGMGFYGFWIAGPDLGIGSGYRIQINAVTRILVPMHEFMADSKGANKLLVNVTGFLLWFHVHYIHLEQLIFARENDVVNIDLYSPAAHLVQTMEFFPLAVIAGNSKQLLINA